MEDKSTTAYRLETAIREKGCSYMELERLSGVPKSAIQRYAKGVTTRIPFDRLLRIADALGVNVWEIIGSDYTYNLEEEGRPLTEKIRSMEKVDLRPFMETLNAPVRIPVLGTIPAGIPIEAIEEILDWEEAPADWARGGKEYFALKITGDSMEPEYRAGDVVIFRRQDDCENGDDCAVLVNGNDATFKRVRKSEKGVTLMPLNPAYEPMFYSVQEADELPIRVLGVVVQLRREPKRGRV